MASVEELKRLLAEAEHKQAREDAIHRLDRAIETESLITNIEAQDAAESHRSIGLAFTVEESRAIFEAARSILAKAD
jgi:hypothetical protein